MYIKHLLSWSIASAICITPIQAFAITLVPSFAPNIAVKEIRKRDNRQQKKVNRRDIDDNDTIPKKSINTPKKQSPKLTFKKREKVSKKLSRYQQLIRKISPILYKSDDSILRFVWPRDPLNNKQYIPKDLVSFASRYVRWNGLLQKDAKKALDLMSYDFYQTFRKPIVIVSPYRSHQKQAYITKRRPQCVKNWLCATPWHSEHQLWLAIDIFGLSNSIFWHGEYKTYYDWFAKNAHKYGYIQSYQRGRKIDGYQRENWHWRYVGVNMAIRLKELGWTYTQYIQYQKSQQ